ncbi:MAG: glycoside hydrolase family 76 protein [Alistipes sp.]
MKKYLIISLAAMAVLASSCGEDDFYYGKEVNPDPNAYLQTPYKINWKAAADSTSFEFIKQFYCVLQNDAYRYNGVFSYTEYNSRADNFNNYWQQAHAMEVMIEFYNRLKAGQTTEVLTTMNANPNVSLPEDTSAEIKQSRLKDQITLATIEGYFAKWFAKHGNNYDGGYAGASGFGNNFTDDTAWIVQTLSELYDATGDVKYYKAAKQTYDDTIWPRWDYVNGGLPWKADNGSKNECTNGPACINACRLALYAQANGEEADYEKYKAQAILIFDFLSSSLFVATTGQVGVGPLSYTQGTFMEAGRLLYQMTSNKEYLRDAAKAARFQMTAPSMLTAGLMRDEGADENNSIFKGVLFHYAKNFILDPNFDKVDASVRSDLKNFVTYHANCAWTVGVDKTTWPNSYFDVYYKVRRSAFGGSQGAQASACTAIEAMTQIENVKF